MNRSSIVFPVILHWKELFSRDHCPAPAAFADYSTVWAPLAHVADLIRSVVAARPQFYTDVGVDVWVGPGTRIARTATIEGPALFGSDCEIRHAAFVRGTALVGNRCIVGNSTELKNCILFDEVQVPHFNYVGDSVLGYKAHLGAGAILSNVRLDHQTVVVRAGKEQIDTGRVKLGSMIGDGVEVGCNSVCNPGTVIGRNAIIHPLSIVRGTVPSGTTVIFPGNVNQDQTATS